MNVPMFSLPLACDADVVTARLSARRAVELLGMDRQSQTRVATAVSEIARNAVVHGGGGQMAFAIDRLPAPTVIEVQITDQGPGIEALDEVLLGRVQFEPGFGQGLQSARRLVHDMAVVSAPGKGTQVRLRQRIPSELAARLTRARIDAITQAAPSRGVDPMTVLHQQNIEIVESLDGLQARTDEAERLNRELDETNRGVVALYSELDHKAEQLRQVSDLKSRFLSHMSHEFRTPLSSILALSRLLSDRVDGELNPEQEKQVEYIRRSAQDLLEMVNDLLDLAKVEAGKLDIKPDAFTVSELFGSLRGSLKPLQQGREVELVFEEPGELPPMFADESKVTQILRNFVSNALKFTERGRVTVRARLLADANQIRFEVADTGIGIAADQQKHLFEDFSQLDGRLQHGGTGLGLSLSRRLATLLGGEVSVDSALGKGSVFALVLPVRWGEVRKPTVPVADQPRILVVDDEESFRYVLKHIAQDAGLQVIEAVDGIEGMRRAGDDAPEVIVLDLQMPRRNGFEMLAELAASTALAAIPVIVCTSQALTLEQKLSLSGAYAIVAKHDLSRDGLTALIRAALATRKETTP
ncbi:MAG TPA: ATP-binding protein [Burkholderiaceae bacterium]|jgi:signal transduction histidine kinase/ActR/RegA family two-component response regulator